jgi:peptide chain release factor 1
MDIQQMVERLELVESRYTDLTRLMADPDIAADYEKVAEYAKERAEIQEIVEGYHQYQANSADLAAAKEMLSDEDPGIRDLATEEIAKLEAEIDTQVQQLRKLLVPKDPRDERNVIVEIRAGAGGDEAGLFAAELLRLYTRYAERQPKWQVELISENNTGIGGYKEVVFTIKGKGAYSRLKYESGVHRVQRVPVTESSGRIHTSTVTVAVLPEVDEVEVNINPKDLEMTTYGSSGPGGQHMQKNDTAVRIIHIPTGTVVTCESERSLTQNKNRAMSVLRARIYEEELHRRASEIDADRRAQVGTGERSEKIRTYNYPQNRVTDHRIGMNSYNLPAVMEGDIDDFIEALALDEEMRRLADLE